MFQKIMTSALCSLFFVLFLAQPAFTQQDAMLMGADAALKALVDDTLSYFSSAAGKVISVQGNSVRIGTGSKDFLKKGMRLSAYKESANFVHPVTKEPLGKIEAPIGTIEVASVSEHEATCIIVTGDPKHFMDATLRIPATRIRMLFYQGDIDWFLGDAYYQKLKATNRFELIDTAVEAYDIPTILTDAKTKGADAVLVLFSRTSAGQVTLEQKLFWVGDTKEFAHQEVVADADSVKELRMKTGTFIPTVSEMLLSFRLPYRADRLAAGDLTGDGNVEILLASGSRIRVYRPGSDLKAMDEFSVPAGDIIWMDAVDLDKNGKDDILITTVYNDKVISYIYEFRNSSYIQLLKKEDWFFRKLGYQAIAQEFSKREGYDGPVYFFTLSDKTFKKGEALKLPAGVNIYDFQRFSSAEGKQSLAAWNENGFLQVFNDQGIRLWASKENFGGFRMTFSKEEGLFFGDRGKWSVKDRLLVFNNELLAPKRKPLLGMVKSLGYSSSSIRGLWWNGSAIEERDFIEKAGGELLDYDLLGDRMAVLAKEALTTKAVHLLEGESPFGVMLYLFSIKGK